MQKTTVVADGFLYSNGVALSADGDYVLVVETGAGRVWRIWLHGDNVSAPLWSSSFERAGRALRSTTRTQNDQ